MNYTRALAAVIATDWAINENWMQSAMRVFAGIKGEIPPKQPDSDVAFLMTGAERPTGTRYTYVKENTAVVDIYGAIIPRANLYSEYSGGTSCQMLLKDITWLKSQAYIENVLFVIHSPGGDVVGISDTGKAIKELSQTKNVNAYISGMGCSAAYWLATNCQKIYANENATVGSIGVMSVYTDDSKQLEMIGLEEIEFISSQSPLKNADPKTKQGAAEIQKRVNDQAAIFIQTVAQNRQTSVQDVIANFGQGGVFAGIGLKKAIKNNVIDYIGSFNDALALIEPEMSLDEDEVDENIPENDAQVSSNEDETANAETTQGENEMDEKTFVEKLEKDEGFLAKLKSALGIAKADSSNVSATADETIAAEREARINAEKELEAFKAKQLQDAQTAKEKDAADFVNGLVTANKITPADAELVKAQVLGAANPDEMKSFISKLVEGNKASTLITKTDASGKTETLALNGEDKGLTDEEKAKLPAAFQVSTGGKK